MTQWRMPKVDILGVKVDRLDKTNLEHAIVTCINEKRKEVFAYVNINGVNLARTNGAIKDFYNSRATVYCDGEGVRLGAWLLGTRLPARTVLTRWVWDLCALCEVHMFSVFFLGGEEGTVTAAVNQVRRKFPRLRIAGAHHGYFGKEGVESDKVVETVNNAHADLIFVALGMPAQELWIARNMKRMNVHAILPAGSMMEYVAGRKAIAPPWMLAFGLEWLYRLGQEPRRLWQRYLIGNPKFMASIILQRLRSGKST